jgi:hypothetical protein
LADIDPAQEAKQTRPTGAADRSRREMLSLAALMAAAGPAAARTRGKAADTERPGRMEADLNRYAAFGGKMSGGHGDDAAGDWLSATLSSLDYTVRRDSFDMPFFADAEAQLAVGGRGVTLLPLAISKQTPSEGLQGPLVRVSEANMNIADVAGSIALVDLPHARWSSVEPLRTPLAALFRRGAIAAVIITNGPSGLAIQLNVDATRPAFAGPVAMLAPADAAPLLIAASGNLPGRLVLRMTTGTRPAFNIVGERPMTGAPKIIVSTPRSGWFACAGERGPGVAVWLELARTLPRAVPAASLVFLCTSGHEYENHGIAQLLRHDMPAPEATLLWLHLGANVAARDWHDLLQPLTPLSTVDPQRYLAVSPALLAYARNAFAGEPGLADPIDATGAVEGELGLLARRYPRVAGIYGAHRFHHTEADDNRMLLPAALPAVVDGMTDLVHACLSDPAIRSTL